VERKKSKAEEVLKERKKEHGKVVRDQAQSDQQVREKETEINKMRPKLIKSKEQVDHMKKKLESARKSLQQARKADEAHMSDIRELEAEYEKVEELRREFEDLIAGESQSQGRDVHLQDAQV